MKKLILAALIALPMSVFAQKFAHVNSATIIQAMPEYTTAQTEMQTLTKTYEDELTRKTELQELNQRIQQYYQTSQEELQKAQQTKMQAIQKKVTDAIKEVGVSGGYVYIMDVTAGIPFINETISTDVTSQVMAKLGIK